MDDLILQGLESSDLIIGFGLLQTFGFVQGVFSAVVAAVEAAVGYVGAKLTRDYIFPEAEVELPKLGPLDANPGEEGAPIMQCWGPNCRVPLTEIYVSEVRVKKVKNSQGKGGGGSTTTEYYNLVDIALGACYRSPSRGPITGWTKILSGAEVIWGTNPNKAASSDEWTAENLVTNAKGTFIDIVAPDTTFKLKKFKSGKETVMSGWQSGLAGNNGTFTLVAKWKKDKVWHLRLKDTADPPTVEEGTASQSVTIEQTNVPNFWVNKVGEVEFYLGSHSQGRDPLLVSNLGELQVSPNRGLAYAVIEDFRVNDYGNRIPQMDGILEADEEITLDEVIGDILSETGRSSTNWNVTEVSDIYVDGFVTPMAATPEQKLRQLLNAYDVLTREDDGILVFFKRGNAVSVQIDETVLGASGLDDESVRKLAFADSDPTSLPSHIQLDYRDVGYNYAKGSVTFVRNDFEIENRQPIRFNISFTREAASAIAQRLMYLAIVNGRTVKMPLPPTYWAVVRGDVLVYEATTGEVYSFLVTERERGANGLILITARVEESGLLDFSGDGSTTDPDGNIYLPSATVMEVLDIPALTNEHTNTPGVYIAGCLLDPTEVWEGAVAYWANTGDDHAILTTLPDETIMGYCENALPTVVGMYGVVDRINTVDVWLYHGEMESVTLAEAHGGANLCLIGNELCIPLGADLLESNGPLNKYRLSRILRGRRGTGAIAFNLGIYPSTALDNGHVAGERFVKLSADMRFVALGEEQFKTVKDYKLVPEGGNPLDYPTDVEAQPFDLNTVIPQSIVSIHVNPPIGGTGSSSFLAISIPDSQGPPMGGSGNGGRDRTIKWGRRSRGIINMLYREEKPILEEFERYELKIYGHTYNIDPVSSPAFTLRRTEIIENAREFEYTTVMQNSDGFNSAHSYQYCYISIRQIGSSLGESVPTAFPALPAQFLGQIP